MKKGQLGKMAKKWVSSFLKEAGPDFKLSKKNAVMLAFKKARKK